MTATPRRSLARRAALLGAATLVTAATIALSAGTASAQGAPLEPNSPQMVGMYDSPAVELVTNQDRATVTWYDADVDLTGLVTFANQDPATRSAWSANDFAGASADIVTHLLNEPANYLSKGAGTSKRPTITAWGSAWGVSSDGYLVTNHHVTEPISDADFVDSATAANATSGTASPAEIVASSIQKQLTGIHWGSQSLTLTDAGASSIQDLATAWITTTSTVSQRSQTIYVGGDQSRSGSDPGKPAHVVRTSPKTWPHEDVAILKIASANLPTLPLGTDTTVQAGDTVYALGYPWDASFDSANAASATVTATLSYGQVTNRVTSPDGFAAIEDSATINHGSSGGALLDSAGRAIGIVTAVDSSTEKDNGVNGGKFFYAVPVSVVKKYLKSAGVTPHASADQNLYEHAMVLMQQAHYSSALSELRRVQADGFSTAYVAMHVRMVQQAINAGEDKPLHDRQAPLLFILIGVAALTIVTATAALLVRAARRRNAHQPRFPQVRTPWTRPPQSGFQPSGFQQNDCWSDFGAQQPTAATAPWRG